MHTLEVNAHFPLITLMKLLKGLWINKHIKIPHKSQWSYKSNPNSVGKARETRGFVELNTIGVPSEDQLHNL